MAGNVQVQSLGDLSQLNNSPGAVEVLHPREGASLCFYRGIIPEGSRAWLLYLDAACPLWLQFLKGSRALGHTTLCGHFWGETSSLQHLNLWWAGKCFPKTPFCAGNPPLPSMAREAAPAVLWAGWESPGLPACPSSWLEADGRGFCMATAVRREGERALH